MKPWIKTEVTNHCEQIIGIQPTPEMSNCIEVYFAEMDNSKCSGILYISKDELPVIVKKLQEMMEYVTTK